MRSSREMTDRELKREIRRISRNLSKRISNLERLGITTSRETIRKYHELEAEIAALNILDRKELTQLYRDINYINNLKTSTVRGSLKAQINFRPIEEYISELSEEDNKTFWHAYNTLVEDRMISNYFKYEAMKIARIIFEKKLNATEVRESFIKNLHDIQRKYGASISDDKFRNIVNKEINDIFVSEGYFMEDIF